MKAAFALHIGIAFATVGIPLSAHAALSLPPNDGFVTDDAQILSVEEELTLESELSAYRTQTSNEIAVLIIPSLSGAVISDVGVEVMREWGIGSSKRDNGILLLIAYADHEIGITTGYGLEGAVPDLVASGIIEEDMVPHFRDGNPYEGIRAAVASLQKHIGGEYTADRYAESSDDAGWFGWFIFFLFFILNIFATVFARTRSWWLGGVVGAVFGILLTIIYGWWLSIPFFVALGLLSDYLLSRTGIRHAVMHRRNTFGSGFRGGPGGGGFGGFGGGSTGGGGAHGRW